MVRLFGLSCQQNLVFVRHLVWKTIAFAFSASVFDVSSFLFLPRRARGG